MIWRLRKRSRCGSVRDSHRACRAGSTRSNPTPRRPRRSTAGTQRTEAPDERDDEHSNPRVSEASWLVPAAHWRSAGASPACACPRTRCRTRGRRNANDSPNPDHHLGPRRPRLRGGPLWHHALGPRRPRRADGIVRAGRARAVHLPELSPEETAEYLRWYLATYPGQVRRYFGLEKATGTLEEAQFLALRHPVFLIEEA